MKGRLELTTGTVCSESVNLLNEVNRIRHNDSSYLIPQLVTAFNDVKKLEKEGDISQPLEKIKHLISFEYDPGLTKDEKTVLEAAITYLDLNISLQRIKSKIEDTSDGVFKENTSSKEIEAEYLVMKMKKIPDVTEVKAKVMRELKNEAKSTTVDGILGLDQRAPYVPTKNPQDKRKYQSPLSSPRTISTSKSSLYSREPTSPRSPEPRKTTGPNKRGKE